MLYQAQMSASLWVDAFLTANFLINLLPTTANTDKISPYAKLHGTTPIYTSLRVFGCACFPYLRPYAENKFDSKSLMCVFLGYSEQHKGYRCLYPLTGRVYLSRHVLFDENQFPYSDIFKDFVPAAVTTLSKAWQTTTSSVTEEPFQSPTVTEEEQMPAPRQQQTQPPAAPSSSGSSSSSQQSETDTDDENHLEQQPPVITQAATPPVVNTEPVHSMVTRGRSDIMKPNPRYIMHTVKDLPTVPRTLKASLSHPGWNEATKEEIDTCEETETFSLVPLPQDVKPLGSGWVHQVKLNSDGTFKCYRSRLVAKGNEQEEGVDFLETYSPVVRTTTVRMVLHLAVTEKWPIK